MTVAAETAPLGKRERPIDLRMAMAAAILCSLGFAATVWLMLQGWLAEFDRAGLLLWRGDGLKPTGPPFLLDAVKDLTVLSGVWFRNLFALAAAAALVLLRLRRNAVLLMLTVTGGWIANSGMKAIFGRIRPDVVPHLTQAEGYSFPSGHSFNGAVVYIAIALAFAAMSDRLSVRVVTIGSAVVISLAIASSRVWLGVHYPSDVIAGWLGGAGWAFLSAALFWRPASTAAYSIGK